MSDNATPTNQPTLPDRALPPNERSDYIPEDNGEKLLAGKYKTVEELEKGYSELVKRLGAPREPAEGDPKAPEGTPTGNTPKAPQEAPEGAPGSAEEAVQKAGLDWSALSAEFEQAGELSEESYKALAEKSGIPREIVDQYIEGQVAVRERLRGEVFSVVGGEKEYATMVEWAAKNLDVKEIDTFNKITSGNDIGAIKLAVQGLKAKFVAAEGSAPKLVQGTPSAVVGYRSVEEMKRDMADPRYATDPAFREDVLNRLKVSTNI